MRSFRFLVICLLSLTLPAQALAEIPNLVQLVAKVMPGVVNISSITVERFQVFGMDEFLNLWGVPQERKQQSLGSGVLIDKDGGYLLTNSHVVEHATEVLVTLKDSRQFRAKIIGKDKKMDLALLQIRDKDRKTPKNLVALPLGNSDAVQVAESVFAVGNPFGLSHTVTHGIISALNRTIGVGPFDNFLQTDTPINPGNSGGPLFNAQGEVIGINTVIYSRVGQSGGINFAIPSNEASRIVPDLKRYGHVPRPWLGILGEKVTPQLEEHYDLPVSRGVLVYNLVASGPADSKGMRQGDIIVNLDGTTINEPNDIERTLARHKPGETVSLALRRGSKTLELKIRLEELPPLDNLPKGII